MNGSNNGGNSINYYGSGDNSIKVNNNIDIHRTTVPTQPHRTPDRGSSSAAAVITTAAAPSLNHQTVNQRLAFSIVEDEVVTGLSYFAKL